MNRDQFLAKKYPRKDALVEVCCYGDDDYLLTDGFAMLRSPA